MRRNVHRHAVVAGEGFEAPCLITGKVEDSPVEGRDSSRAFRCTDERRRRKVEAVVRSDPSKCFEAADQFLVDRVAGGAILGLGQIGAGAGCAGDQA